MYRFAFSVCFLFFFTALSAQKNKSVPVKHHPIDTSKFVLVQGGTFKMGTGKPVEPHEGPVHPVTLSDYYIAKTEVTFNDLDQWCKATGRDTFPAGPWGRGQQVAIIVSWVDAVNYCNWLSEKEKLSKCYIVEGENAVFLDTAKGYRLPTEAEWEFAARGGNKSKGTFFSGSDVISEAGWYQVNSGQVPHAVAQKKANELGLFDMSGNVWEWVWDWYDAGYYQHSPVANPQGPPSGNYRVMRGGAWYNQAEYVNVYTRQNAGPAFKQNSVGFRVARTYY